MGVTATCPRCGALITATLDTSGVITCRRCGVRLRAAAAAPVKNAEPDPATATPAILSGPVARSEALGDARALPETEAALLAGMRAVRQGQQEILQSLAEILTLLNSRPARADTAPLPPAETILGAFPEPPPEAPVPSAPARIRRRQKSVLLIDDDEETRAAAQTALAEAHLPVRAVADGGRAIAAIATEKPDVIVLELGLGGSMPGRDVVNMIKATMEWINIPIVLYTRLAIGTQNDARTLHGADELVPKGPGAAAVLVARVIEIFQRG